MREIKVQDPIEFVGGTFGSSLCRRQVLQGIGATVGVALASGSISEAFADTPRRGGTLKMAWSSSPRMLDPALTVQGDEYMLTANIFDNLTRIDENLQPQPQLATKWENQEAREWTFTLREGVRFHHGRIFTSEDVVFTFQRILDPATASPGRSIFTMIDRVEAVGPLTVRFVLNQPFADFPISVGGTFARILPADRPENIGTAPSGTGPFQLAEFQPGDRTVLTRFADYWDTGKPYLDELWQVNLPQAAPQVASLSGGDTHMIFEAPAAFIRTLEALPDISVVRVLSPAYQYVVMQADQKPFDDEKVRLALKFAVDRQALVRTVWLNNAIPSVDHPVATISPFFSDVSNPHPYDPAKAKALLAEAGYAEGIDLEFWTSNERLGLQELGVGIQQMMAPAGIRVKLQTVTWSIFTSTVYKKKPFYANNLFGRATIDESLYAFFHSASSYNEGNLKLPALDRLLEEGRSEVDLEKRKKSYAEAQQLIHDQGYVIVPYHMNYVTAMRKTVKGYKVHPLRFCDFRQTYLDA